MEHLSKRNLKRLIADIQGDMSSFSSGTVCTFEEVYRNLASLDERIEGVTYNAQTETITIPESIGSFANETIIIT